MERLWRMFSHRQPDGNCNQQDQAILHVRLYSYNGFSNYPLHDPRILEKYAKIYLGGETESLVLFVVNSKWVLASD